MIDTKPTTIVPRSTGGGTGGPGSKGGFGGVIHAEHGCVIAEVDDGFPNLDRDVGGVWVRKTTKVGSRRARKRGQRGRRGGRRSRRGERILIDRGNGVC